MASRVCDPYCCVDTILHCSVLSNGRLESPALDRLDTLVIDNEYAEVECVKLNVLRPKKRRKV
jgi:hypothetical protein